MLEQAFGFQLSWMFNVPAGFGSSVEDVRTASRTLLPNLSPEDVEDLNEFVRAQTGLGSRVVLPRNFVKVGGSGSQ